MYNDKDRHVSRGVWMLLPEKSRKEKKRAGRKPGFIFTFSFLQPSTVKAFDVIIHTQAVSLTKALFRSAVHNVPLMDSANISIYINGLLLTPTKSSMEHRTCQHCPINGLILSSQKPTVNICCVVNVAEAVVFGTISAVRAMRICHFKLLPVSF